MTREEAVKVLHEIEDKWLEPKTHLHRRENEALDLAITALRSPWVKTEDRLPEEREGDHVLVATYDADRRQWIRWVTSRGLVKSCPQIEWWTPNPTLPEAAK